MKLQSNNLLENLTTEELKSLKIQVRETVTKDYKKEKKRIFSAADLWDIHRKRRNLIVKRSIV